MLIPGLTSVSFRNEKPETILWHAKQAGLRCIEWGSDIHVPVGDTGLAEAVKRMTVNEGLTNSSYGSYYKIGCNTGGVDGFSDILHTAALLEVPIIRIWGGEKPSAGIEDNLFQQMVAETKIICELASQMGITLSLECHINTITDDYKSSLRFLNAVASPNLKMYWQPNQSKTDRYNLEAAKELLPHVTNVHVFHWDNEGKRFPLKEGAEIWLQYIEIFSNDTKDHNLLLEFMHDGELSSLEETAQTLISWL